MERNREEERRGEERRGEEWRGEERRAEEGRGGQRRAEEGRGGQRRAEEGTTGAGPRPAEESARAGGTGHERSASAQRPTRVPRAVATAHAPLRPLSRRPSCARYSAFLASLRKRVSAASTSSTRSCSAATSSASCHHHRASVPGEPGERVRQRELRLLPRRPRLSAPVQSPPVLSTPRTQAHSAWRRGAWRRGAWRRGAWRRRGACGGARGRSPALSSS
jgi:hypothetical protein